MLFFSIFLTNFVLAAPLHEVDLTLPDDLNKMSEQASLQVFTDLEKKHQANPYNLFWIKYKKAKFYRKKNPSIFCKETRLLSKEHRFVMRDVARIHFYSLCPSKEEISFDLKKFPRWLHKQASIAFFERGKKFKDKQLILEASQYLGKNAVYRSSRVSYLQEAVKAAKELRAKNQKQLQNLLYKLAPRFKPKPQFKEYLKIAHDYRRNRFFSKSIYYYRKVLNAKNASYEQKNECFRRLKQVYRAKNFQGSVAKVNRQWDAFLKRTNTKKSWETYYLNKIQRAREYWNYDHNAKALDILDAVIQEPKSIRMRYQAHWLKAAIKQKDKLFEESLGEIEKAISLFKKFKIKDPEFLDKAKWKQAWILRSVQKHEEALKSF